MIINILQIIILIFYNNKNKKFVNFNEEDICGDLYTQIIKTFSYKFFSFFKTKSDCYGFKNRVAMRLKMRLRLRIGFQKLQADDPWNKRQMNVRVIV